MRQQKKRLSSLSRLVPEREPLIGFSARLELEYLDMMNAITRSQNLTRSDFLRAAIRYFHTKLDGVSK